MFNLLSILKPRPQLRADNHHNLRQSRHRLIKVRYAITGGNPNNKIIDAVQAGLEMWAATNPHLAFTRTHRRAPLMIKFRPFPKNPLNPNTACGRATMGTFPRGVISLDTHITSPSQMKRIVAHEFGHIVGYGHRESGLMGHGQRVYDAGDEERFLIRDKRKARRFRLPPEPDTR